MMSNGTRLETMQALRFAGKFLAGLTGIVVCLLTLRSAFALSRWAGLLSLVILTVALYVSAHRWVKWLPGLLIFGVLNSLFVLSTGQAPTNPRVTISAGLGVLLLSFYAVGYIISYRYDADHLSVLDRLAWLLYLGGMILPGALTLGSNSGTVTPSIAWPMITAMVAIAVSFAVQRLRRGNPSVDPSP